MNISKYPPKRQRLMLSNTQFGPFLKTVILNSHHHAWIESRPNQIDPFTMLLNNPSLSHNSFFLFTLYNVGSLFFLTIFYLQH
jgi:hypothetical protein